MEIFQSKRLCFHNWESTKELHHQSKQLSQLKAVLSYLRWEYPSPRLTFCQDGGQLGASGELKNGPQWQTTAKGQSVWICCTRVLSWAGARRWHYQVGIFILVEHLNQSRPLGTSILFLIQLYQWTGKCSDCSSLLSAGVPSLVLDQQNDHL